MTHQETASPAGALHTGYRGADEQWHPYSPASLTAVAEALAHHRPASAQHHLAGLPATAVIVEGEPHYLPLALSPAECHRLLQTEWEVVLEDGTRVPVQLTTTATPASAAESAPSGAVAAERTPADAVAAEHTPADAIAAKRVLAVEIPATLPQGYHRLMMTTAGKRHPATYLIVTPARLEVRPAQQHVWGFTVQIYSLRSEHSWSMGDSHDLHELCQWAAQEGADFVSINPIHAGSPVAPVENSPYLPQSRHYFSVLMVAVEDLPEYHRATAKCRAAIAEIAAPLKARNHSSALLDRSAVHTAKMRALELLWDDGAHTLRHRHYVDFCRREGQQLRHFALWCALVEKYGKDNAVLWEDDHGPDSSWAQNEAAELEPRIHFHQWVQFVIVEQLRAVQQAARAAGMSIGIVHDLAVGVGQRSADVWSLPSLMVPEVTVGAPPDTYNQLGQNWNQPPWHPQSLAEVGYQPFIHMIRALCETGGGVRIDHVLGLFRLWWIPRGMSPTEGVYVPFPYHDLLRIIILEAHRHGCVIIGEDLGTVADYVRDTLSHYGIWGTSVLWYEYDKHGQLRAPQDIRTTCMLTVSTHDMPPVSAYLAGKQVDLRSDLGILGQSREAEWHSYLRNRADIVTMGARMGVWPPATEPGSDAEVLAIHRLMWMAPATAKAIALVDVVAEQRSQNVPGTDREYPNWCVPLCDRYGRAVTVQEIAESPLWAALKAHIVDD